MGISNPHISFHCLHAPVRPIAGSTAFVAQSGNLGAQLLAFAEKEGIGIRAFCGSGNEAMLTIEDYLEGFAVDKITKTVVLYIESVKEGKRFFRAASRVGKIKPVIVLKGGRTQAGSQAAASHTGAMASDIKVFNAASRQAGIILAESPMDLLDLSATFSSLPLPRGNKVGIMTMGGGWGVVTCDLCIENGLSVPELPPELIARINPLLPPFWSHANPIDLVATRDREIHNIILEELLKWPGCDAVIHMGMVGALSIARRRLEAALAADENYDEKFMSDSLKLVAQAEKQFIEKSVYLMGKYQKPVVGVTIATDDTLRTVTDVKDSIYKAVAFVTPEKAVKSLARMFKYAQWLKD
jgi:acyl-CoA synthetase (NDP forming)